MRLFLQVHCLCTVSYKYTAFIIYNLTLRKHFKIHLAHIPWSFDMVVVVLIDEITESYAKDVKGKEMV